jgi:hypothetical protein
MVSQLLHCFKAKQRQYFNASSCKPLTSTSVYWCSATFLRCLLHADSRIAVISALILERQIQETTEAIPISSKTVTDISSLGALFALLGSTVVSRKAREHGLQLIGTVFDASSLQQPLLI